MKIVRISTGETREREDVEHFRNTAFSVAPGRDCVQNRQDLNLHEEEVLLLGTVTAF